MHSLLTFFFFSGMDVNMMLVEEACMCGVLHMLKGGGDSPPKTIPMNQFLLEDGSSLFLLRPLLCFRKFLSNAPPFLVYLDGVVLHSEWYWEMVCSFFLW